MIDKILFGKKLRELREKHGMTQEQLSNLLDIDWQHISRLENGKNLPSCNILISIAKIFDIDIRNLTEYEYLNNNFDVDKEISKLLMQANKEQKIIFYKIMYSTLK
ncbi:helix-turn-helix transcriptional regulator [bacterium]|nr:helix-turn-helix transcriptional regulator [bacterium]